MRPLCTHGRHGNPFKGNDIRLLVVRGCTGSVAFVCLVTAIRMLPMSTAMVIFYSYPAFAALFSFFLNRETLSKVHLVCIAGVMIGVSILFDFQLAGGLLILICVIAMNRLQAGHAELDRTTTSRADGTRLIDE